MNIEDLTEKDIERFWSKVDKKGDDECWEWLGSRDREYKRGTWRGFLADRVSYILAYGDIPKNLVLKHIDTCGNSSCCNPSHLCLVKKGWVIDMEKRFVDRFWSHIDKKEENECWIWKKCKSKDGYGQIGYTRNNERKTLKTHRVAYELAYGKIPEGLEVMHICDNPPCCNPSHLSLGTHAENIKDMYLKNRGADTKGTLNGRSILSEKEVLEIRELYKSKNTTYKKLANNFNVSPGCIKSIILGLNWKEIGGKMDVYEDVRYTISKVSKEEVRDIRKLREQEGWSLKSLCDKYNMSKSGMYSIISYETWKDIII